MAWSSTCNVESVVRGTRCEGVTRAHVTDAAQLMKVSFRCRTKQVCSGFMSKSGLGPNQRTLARI